MVKGVCSLCPVGVTSPSPLETPTNAILYWSFSPEGACPDGSGLCEGYANILIDTSVMPNSLLTVLEDDNLISGWWIRIDGLDDAM